MSAKNTIKPFACSGSDRDSRRVGLVESVGNTPLFDLPAISKEVAPVRIAVKAEWYNPGGSVKDRPALNMILEGEKNGKLTPDKIIMDATSGNTGIAYAMVGAALGYRVRLCVPKNIGALRRRCLEAYGAELILTDPTLGSDGAIEEAQRQWAEHGPDVYFYPDQYSNDANWQAHYNSTAVEIWNQTQGEITHFVAGLGTSGTLCGNGRRLKEYDKNIRLVSLQPDSPMHGLEGWKHMATAIVPKIYDETVADEGRVVRTEDAQAMCIRLAREEGLQVSPSAGANIHAALQVARDLKEGLVVAIGPDGAAKYLDFAFWDKAKQGIVEAKQGFVEAKQSFVEAKG